MKKGRITIGTKFSAGVPGKKTTGEEVQEASSGFGLLILCIALASLIFMATAKGCNEELRKENAQA